VLREQPSCRAISRTPSPLRAITRISTACSWVNIDGQKTVSFAQVGQIYFGAVGQFCIGGDRKVGSGNAWIRSLIDSLHSSFADHSQENCRSMARIGDWYRCTRSAMSHCEDMQRRWIDCTAPEDATVGQLPSETSRNL
jgi:hypothetical protein